MTNEISSTLPICNNQNEFVYMCILELQSLCQKDLLVHRYHKALFFPLKNQKNPALSGRIMFKEHLIPGVLSQYFPLGVEEQIDSQRNRFQTQITSHSSTLAWKIPWTDEPGRLQSMGSQRVGHDWATSLSTHGNKARGKTNLPYFSSENVWLLGIESWFFVLVFSR